MGIGLARGAWLYSLPEKVVSVAHMQVVSNCFTSLIHFSVQIGLIKIGWWESIWQTLLVAVCKQAVSDLLLLAGKAEIGIALLQQ